MPRRHLSRRLQYLSKNRYDFQGFVEDVTEVSERRQLPPDERELQKSRATQSRCDSATFACDSRHGQLSADQRGVGCTRLVGEYPLLEYECFAYKFETEWQSRCQRLPGAVGTARRTWRSDWTSKDVRRRLGRFL